MDRSKVIVSFVLLFVLLLPSHVVTHELMKGYYPAANYNDPPPAYIYDPWANFRHLPSPPQPTKKSPRHGSQHLHHHHHPHPHLRP
ncbi:hypothetical protein HN51_023792 [Arachis hypogaea]|nr:uncharacterized protein DS421_7g202150 [Arachis hypogaea]